MILDDEPSFQGRFLNRAALVCSWLALHNASINFIFSRFTIVVTYTEDNLFSLSVVGACTITFSLFSNDEFGLHLNRN